MSTSSHRGYINIGLVRSNTGSIIDTNSTLSVFGSNVFYIALVFGFVIWILTLIKTAQIQRWGWFVVILLLGVFSVSILAPPGALIYGFAGPLKKKV